MRADDVAEGGLDDLAVDGAVRAVAAGGAHVPGEDGDEGGFVELEDEAGAGDAPSHLGQVEPQPLGQRAGQVTAGAGVGALTANLKGGLGSASLVIPGGYTVGALVVANPTGSATMGDTRHFWAAPFEVGDEFGGLGPLTTPMPFEQTSPAE